MHGVPETMLGMRVQEVDKATGPGCLRRVQGPAGSPPVSIQIVAAHTRYKPHTRWCRDGAIYT